MLLKLATPREAFAKIQAVVPEAVDWAYASARGGAGRTGEMLTLITPDNIRARILAEGFSEEDIDQLGHSLGDFLTEHAGPEVTDRVSGIVPFVTGLPTRR